MPLDNLLGAWLIGLIMSAVLFGVTCLQVYIYFTKHCVRDRIFMKVFVALLLSLDTLHLALASWSLYSATVTNFGDYVQLAKPAWSFLIQIMIGSLLSIQIQLFYAFRLHILSHKRLVVPTIIAICAVAQFGLVIALTRRSFQADAFKTAGKDTPYTTGTLSLDVACDFMITAAMIYYLLRNKSDILHRTNRAINLLISYFVSSGALTMVFAVCTLVARVISPTTLVYTPFLWAGVRLYGLSFMTILNSREHVREQLFSSHAMVTLPPALSNTTRPTDDTHESIVFDNHSKHEPQVV
ncbi:hypothetical protein DFH06DRAFT_1320291 [Mycena polygramma]|nr:hypothetical protein DFH06DRAFT_1320291 [Mycena polygramma]